MSIIDFINLKTTFMQQPNIHPDIQFNPQATFQTFRKLYNLSDAKARLAEWLEVALTTDNMPYDDFKSREELCQFCHMLEDVVEAIWVDRYEQDKA